MHRLITGNLLQPNGNPYRGSVKFVFSGAYTSNYILPAYTETVRIDSNGNIKASLWINEQGDNDSFYTCVLPDNESFEFRLNLGSEELNLSTLKATSIPPSNPSYNSILNFISSLGATTPKAEIINPLALPIALERSPNILTSTLFVNGIKTKLGIDYQINSNILLWIGSMSLDSNDSLEFYY